MTVPLNYARLCSEYVGTNLILACAVVLVSWALNWELLSWSASVAFNVCIVPALKIVDCNPQIKHPIGTVKRAKVISLHAGKFYCPRMASMNKPAYAAIQVGFSALISNEGAQWQMSKP